LATLVLTIVTASAATAQGGLPARLQHASATERRAAVEAVAALGDKAKPHAAALVARLGDNDDTVRLAAIDACVTLQDHVRADLEAALPQAPARSALAIAAVFGLRGDVPTGKLPDDFATELDAALASSDVMTRRIAASAVGAMSSWPTRTVAALVRLCRDVDPDVKRAAGNCIRRHAERLAPTLRAALQTEPALGSVALVETLWGDSAATRSVLGTLTAHADDGTAIAALERLATWQELAVDQLPAIEAALADPRPTRQPAALVAYARVANDEDAVAARGAAALQASDPRLQAAGARALAQQRFRFPDWMPNLLAMLGQTATRDDAAQLLASMPTMSRSRVAAELASKDPLLRLAAMRALGYGLTPTPEETKQLSTWLRSKDAELRLGTLALFAGMWPPPADCLPQVVDACRGEDVVAALRALRSYREDAAEARAKVLPLLKDKRAVVRSEAAYTLGNIAGGRHDVLQALARGTKDEQSGQACFWVLGQWRQDNAAAVRELKQLAQQNKGAVRLDALTTLARVVWNDAEPIEQLTRLAKEGPDADRCRAIAALGDLASRQLREATTLPARWRPVLALLQECAAHGSPHLRQTAFEHLGAFGADTAVARVLAEGLLRRGPERIGAALGLAAGAWHATDEQVALLATFATGADKTLAKAACRALGSGGEAARRRLATFANHDDPAVRDRLLDALRDITDPVPLGDGMRACLATRSATGRSNLAWGTAMQGSWRDEAMVARTLVWWQEAATDASQRRTLAEVWVAWIRYGLQHERIVALLQADQDPGVGWHARELSAPK
jgi:hypothetical protein